jgi:phosphatidylglycerophosphate synthase
MTQITRAYLVGPAVADPTQQVAGLSLILRTLLSFQELGIQEVFLQNISLAELPQDPRLRLQIRASQNANGPALVARVGSLWHIGIARRLSQALPQPDEIIGVASSDVALYVAGEEALPRLLQSITEPDKLLVHHDSPVLPEFIVAPTTEAERRQVERLLLLSLLKPTDGLISRHLNRPISLRVTQWLLPTSFTPNQMTLVAAIFGAIGSILAWNGLYWGLIFAALFLQIQSVLDGCDGEIARLKHLKSRLGEWLDQVFDDLINISFLVAVGHGLAQQGSSFAWTVALISLVSHTLYQTSLYTAFWTKAGGRGSVTALRWWGQGGPMKTPSTPLGRLWFSAKRLVEEAGKRDFFTFLYLPCALLGIIQLAFLWHAVIAISSGIITTSQWLLLGGPKSSE